MAPLVVGIDVSGTQLDVAFRCGDREEAGPRTPNDETGIAALVSALSQRAPALLVLEATGGLEVPLVASLVSASIPVAIVNPRQVRHFARSIGRSAKTDALDAKLLALFAQRVRPPVRPLPNGEARALTALVMRRRQLVDTLVAERHRRARAASEPIRESCARLITWLEQEISAVTAELETTIQARPHSRARDDLLQRVRGVGPILAATLIAELPELGILN